MAPKKAEIEEDHLLVASVVKAMKVLEAYDGTRRSMGFSEIARVTGLERSAAQRAAHTLWQLGYLQKASGSGEYRLSIRCTIWAALLRDVENGRASEPLHISSSEENDKASVKSTMLDRSDTVFIQRNAAVASLGNKAGVSCTYARLLYGHWDSHVGPT